MIEIIYSDETKSQEQANTPVKLPKNVRQIGAGGENKKIYVEDYVMTYIGKLWEKPPEESIIGVLLGKVKQSEGNTYIFTSGAIRVDSAVQTGKSILFSDDTWTDIYETIKKYFNELEIVGWFLARNDSAFEIDEGLYKTHIDNFAGMDKLLLLADVEEKEAEFFLYDNGKLVKQGGYYVYYEKNEAMQEYMVEQKQGKSTEEQVDDRVTGNYRAIINEKKEISSQHKLVAALYSACTFLVIVVLAIGVTMMNNYDKMKEMEFTLNSLTSKLTGEENEETSAIPVNAQVGEKTEVELIEGQVDTTPAVTEEETTTELQSSVQQETVTESTSTAAPQTTQNTEAVSTKPERGTYYEIKKGETLTAISVIVYGNDTMVDTIKEANGIEDQDKIFPGDKIYLP